MFLRNEFDKPFVSSVIMLRVLISAVIVLLALAQFILKSVPVHDFCQGAALGLMIGVFFLSFEVKSLEFKDRERPSDVTISSITR